MTSPTPKRDWRAQPREWDDSRRYVAAPVEMEAASSQVQVVRSFAFLDISGFTSFTDEHGPRAAHDLLGSFRLLVRDIAARRGVRVAKWIGDGALLVSVIPENLVAAAVDIASRGTAGDVGVRGGVSTGPVLLLDGDDYVGRALNLASRLCDAVGPGRVLADVDSCVTLPDWIIVKPHASLRLKGLGKRSDILELTIEPSAAGPRVDLMARA
jgi:adenylate cyclase